jgi:outer membrane protein TolC
MRKFWILALSVHCFFSTQAQASPPLKTLDELLTTAIESTEAYQITVKQQNALRYEIDSRENELSPYFETSYRWNQDRRQTWSNTTRSTGSHLLDFSLSKDWSTGTTISFEGSHEYADLSTSTESLHRADWRASLEQDLWRNGFGKSVRLRRAFDQAELSRRQAELIYNQQQLLVDAETIYWNLLVSYLDRDLKTQTLERSKELLSWVRGRAQRSAAEPTDVLQVQALVARRELELAQTNEEIQSLWVAAKKLIPELEVESFLPEPKSLGEARELQSLLWMASNASKNEEPYSLSMLIQQSATREAELNQERTEDDLNPRLGLFAAYGQNGIRSSASRAWGASVKHSKRYAEVGARLSIDLGLRHQYQARRASALSAEAAQLSLVRAQRNSVLGWNEIARLRLDLQQQLGAAQKAAKAQNEKSQAEMKRLEQGRTTVFQTISFEIEASDAQRLVYEIQKQLRLTEAQARLYTANRSLQ